MSLFKGKFLFKLVSFLTKDEKICLFGNMDADSELVLDLNYKDFVKI